MRAREIQDQKDRGRRALRTAAVCCSFAVAVFIMPTISPQGSASLTESEAPLSVIADGAVPLGHPLVHLVVSDSFSKLNDTCVIFGCGFIPKGSSETDIILHNPEDDTKALIFEIILKDSGESIYSSGPVEAGGYINYPKLTKRPEKGRYRAEIIARPQSADTSEQAAEELFEFELLVE